ncbi:MAG TPA: nuclear transport factor 2 family protein [Casimicrobiaceae bacterium]|jgi:ketosteroid isomerase-like protein|nr:nuclear transport factor 2 family protein [Casimicrobiaceae bacterium]
MQRIFVLVGMLLIMFAAHASADDKEALITLDKQWGEAVGKGDKTAVAKFIADNSVSVDDKGMKNKQQQIADIQPAPAGEKYEAVDYKVTFINPDTAIMTHATKGTDAHYSLHVWSRKGGTWQVIATSTTPAARK